MSAHRLLISSLQRGAILVAALSLLLIPVRAGATTGCAPTAATADCCETMQCCQQAPDTVPTAPPASVSSSVDRTIALMAGTRPLLGQLPSVEREFAPTLHHAARLTPGSQALLCVRLI